MSTNAQAADKANVNNSDALFNIPCVQDNGQLVLRSSPQLRAKDDLLSWRSSTASRARYLTQAHYKGVYRQGPDEDESEYRVVLARKWRLGPRPPVDQAALQNAATELYLRQSFLPPPHPMSYGLDLDLLRSQVDLVTKEYSNKCFSFCCHQRLMGANVAILSPAKLYGVKKIVCFGLGSFTNPRFWADGTPYGLLSGSRSVPVEKALQNHVVAMHAARRLGHLALCGRRGPQGQEELAVRFYDPSYTADDVAFLREWFGKAKAAGGDFEKSVSFNVLDGQWAHQMGFVDVDANTLVVAIEPSFPVRQIIMETNTPAAMLWKNHVLDKTTGSTDDISAFVEPCTEVSGKTAVVPGTPIKDPLPSHLRRRLLDNYVQLPMGLALDTPYPISLYISQDIITAANIVPVTGTRRAA